MNSKTLHFSKFVKKQPIITIIEYNVKLYSLSIFYSCIVHGIRCRNQFAWTNKNVFMEIFKLVAKFILSFKFIILTLAYIVIPNGSVSTSQ